MADITADGQLKIDILRANFSPASLPTLRTLAARGRAPVRSLTWAALLSLLPSTTQEWPAARAELRRSYAAARREALRAPDGSLPAGLREEGGRNARVDVSVSVNNPLALEDNNPWQAHFASLESLKTIESDVERAFPEDPLFRRPAVQSGLSRLLFVYCQGVGKEIGYRQGMHELAGVCWSIRAKDAVGNAARGALPRGLEEELTESEDEIEMDSYALFEALMRRAAQWFVWKETEASSPRIASGQASPSLSALPQTPIMATCARVRALLLTHDPQLCAHLDELGIEPQLYVLRWVRLLFTREFPFEDALALWDSLLAADSTLGVVPHVCVAMLLRVRVPLLRADYAGAFTHLLRYPAACEEARSAPAADAETPPLLGDLAGLATSLLVRQACLLRDEASGAAARVAQQNEQILGLEVRFEGRTTPPSPPRARRQQMPRTIATGRPTGQRSGLAGAGLGPGSSEPDAAATSYLPEGLTDLAKGLYSRADALGVNRALVSAMGNVQRTVGAYAAAGAQLAGPGRTASSNDDGFPPALDRVQPISVTAANRAPSASVGAAAGRAAASSAASEQSAVRELEALKASNAAMGAAVGACIEVFERQWTQGGAFGGAKGPRSPGPEETLSGAQIEVLMSLTALKHTRDVLLGLASEFDAATLSWPASPWTDKGPARPSPPAQEVPAAAPPAQVLSYQPRASRNAKPPSSSAGASARPVPAPPAKAGQTPTPSAPAAASAAAAPTPAPSATRPMHNARAFARPAASLGPTSAPPSQTSFTSGSGSGSSGSSATARPTPPPAADPLRADPLSGVATKAAPVRSSTYSSAPPPSTAPSSSNQAQPTPAPAPTAGRTRPSLPPTFSTVTSSSSYPPVAAKPAAPSAAPAPAAAQRPQAVQAQHPLGSPLHAPPAPTERPTRSPMRDPLRDPLS